jgi:hypothetical protein
MTLTPPEESLTTRPALSASHLKRRTIFTGHYLGLRLPGSLATGPWSARLQRSTLAGNDFSHAPVVS